jgi:hypothetical protein
MFVVADPMHDSLALRLCTDGCTRGIRSPGSGVVVDAIESLTTRLYGKPIPLRLGRDALRAGGRYFAEDN